MQRIIRREASSGTADASAQPFTGLTPRMSALLRSRGIATEAEARAYLHPSLDQRNDPMLLHDMDKALHLLEEARRGHKRFIVYGDYDVDGVCGTAILVQTLLQYGLEPPDYPTQYRIPDRHEEGYGLNEDAVRDLIGKTDLLITVDCGITSVHEVELAKAAGLQVIVTDHHALPDVLPEADAVIDPLIPPYPFSGLCGAGVVYQLCRALLGEKAAADCLDLAALATVADMVPLTGENRAIVAFGMKAIEHTRRPGLQALIRAAGFRPPMRSEQVAFGLAPRMNACGRLKSALLAVRLLFEQDEAMAEQIAFEMNRLNEQRKEEERAVLQDAQAQLDGMDLFALRAIVVSGPGYDSGVVGLAAGRLAEKYGYPAVVLAEQGEWAVGSARSVPGVDIYRALKNCRDLFVRFGGHPQAAGLTIRTADIPVFRERLSEAVKAQIGQETVLMPVLQYDDELELSEVNAATVTVLQAMEPFGMANPAPVFRQEQVELWSARAVGQNNAHLKCELAKNGTHRSGIAFRHGDLARRPPDTVDILFSPVMNEFRGNVTYECQISRMIPRSTSVARDVIAEVSGVMRDLSRAVGRPPAPETAVREPVDELKAEHGTMVYCRCAETAQRWHEANPDADLRVLPFTDPCAFSSVVYGVPLDAIRAPYRRIVLADGDLTGLDAALARERFPLARIECLPVSESLRSLLRKCPPGLDALRILYRTLKSLPPDVPAGTIAVSSGLQLEQVVAGLYILAHMELIGLDPQKLSWMMKQMVRKNPEDDPLYQLLLVRKEGK